MNRIKELDGLRGIAILLVIIWHYCAVQIEPESSAALGFLSRLLSITWSGVDLFFVLSGFLIVGILVDAKGSPTYFRTFYIRRVCRIFPLYYLMVGLFVLLPRLGLFTNEWLFARDLPLLSYLTLTQNFFMHNGGFGSNWLGVTWSLAIEEQFYLMIPVMIWWLGRRQLILFFVLSIVLAPLLRHHFGNLGAYVFPFTRADSILLGGLIALAMRSEGSWSIIRKNSRSLVFLLGILAAGIGYLMLKFAGVGDMYLHFVLSLFCGTLLVLSLTLKDTFLNTLLRNRILVWFGLRSYGIYLFHQPVNSVVHQLINGSPVPSLAGFSGVVANLVALAVVAILCEISFRYFESVFLRFGSRFRMASPTDATL